MMDCQLIKKGVWSRATPIVPKSRTGSIKLNNPFASEKPFTPSYEKERHVDMHRLYHFDYHRIWTQEHDEYVTKRKLKFDVPKKSFPIYRKTVKKPAEHQTDMTKKTNKLYANVKPKVKTFFTKNKQVF